MKKTIKILGLALSYIVVAGAGVNVGYTIGSCGNTYVITEGPKGTIGYHSSQRQETVTVVSYDELNDMITSGDSFIAYFHRSSCEICAVVSESLPQFLGHGMKIVSFNMEDYLGSDEYDEIKKQLNFSYFPTFKYYSGGAEVANLNNPLSGDYFDTDIGTERAKIRDSMEEHVIDFIEGAAGKSELIHEEPYGEVIKAERVDKS